MSLWEVYTAGNAYFKSLQKTHEWWMDAQNSYRFRRVMIELLEYGPRLIGADGSNGVDSWWEVEPINGVNQPVNHKGLYPLGRTPNGETEMTFDLWLAIFTRPGQQLIEALRKGEAEQIGEIDQAPWGRLSSIQRVNPKSGHVLTSKVRAERPHILVERVQLDQNGKPVVSDRIAWWEWLDSKQLSEDFWFVPPNV